MKREPPSAPGQPPGPCAGAPRDTFCWAGLALVTLCLLAINHFYYLTNTRVPTYDEAWYLETSLHFYHALADHDPGRFLYLYKTAFQTKAPLISLLPQPFYVLFGTSHWSALLANSLCLVISNLCLFLLARRLFAAEVGLMAVVFYQTMPLVYGLSRTLMAEYALATLVLAWLYLLTASEGLSRGAINFALGVVLGLGLLMKIVFPIFIAGPLLVAWMLRRRRAKPLAGAETFWLWRLCARRPLAAIAVPGLGIAATWYAFNLMNVLRFAWENAYGGIAAGYSATGQPSRLLLAINEGTSLYYAAAVLLLGLGALAAGRKRLQWKELISNERALFLLSWLVAPLLAVSASSNREIRFVIPVLPVVAILVALSIFQMGRRRSLQGVLALLVLILPLRLYAELSFRPAAPSRQTTTQLGPFVLFSSDLGWAHSPDSKGAWGQERIWEAIHRIDTPDGKPHYVIVGVEHPFLNANMLSYLSAYTPSNLRFTSLGYAESSADRAVERIYRMDARFLLMAEGFHGSELPGFLNQVNAEVRRRLDRGELPFRLQLKIVLRENIQALIYKREGA
ncbi:MAG: glycosyltransferase family 39 protein [Acidobacteria bacterium]|nr:glycosyltransferase family 39 protein [Acidobacteriota bacterium]